MTLVLLAGTVSAARGFIGNQRVFSSIVDTNLLTAQLTLPGNRYRSREARLDIYREVTEAIDRTAAVTSSTLVRALPSRGNGGTAERQVVFQDRPEAEELAPTVRTLTVRARYFETRGIPLLRGRDFTHDEAPRTGEVIVNRRFAEVHFADDTPIGQRLQLLGAAVGEGVPEWLTIVGVAPTVRQRLGQSQPEPLVYLPYHVAPPETSVVVVRVEGDPLALAQVLRATIRDLDPDLPLSAVATMADTLRDASWNGRLSWYITLTVTLVALGTVLGL